MESRTVLPPSSDASALASLAIALDGPDVALVGADGAQSPIPDAVHQVLRTVVEAMSQGLAVAITPYNTQLTVQEAADVLGMHRPTLVRLLDHGVIPFEHRGQRRVVMLADIVDYQERLRAKRRASLDEMTRSAPEDGMAGADDPHSS